MLWKLLALALLVLFFYSAYALSLHYKRFRHFFLRLIYLLLRPVALISFLLSKIERRIKSPAWTINGTCLKCGQCCELIAMYVPPFMQDRAWLQNMAKWYYEENFNMTYEAMADGVWMMFSCSNLKNNLCSIYRRRPRICREYPPVDSVIKPDIEPSCGFRLLEKK